MLEDTSTSILSGMALTESRGKQDLHRITAHRIEIQSRHPLNVPLTLSTWALLPLEVV